MNLHFSLQKQSNHINDSDQRQEANAGGDAPPSGGTADADIDSNWDEAIDSFDAMDIPEELLRGIYAYGFEKPSAIQQRAIKPTMLGRDLIAQAQSGTVSVFLFFQKKEGNIIGIAGERGGGDAMARRSCYEGNDDC